MIVKRCPACAVKYRAMAEANRTLGDGWWFRLNRIGAKSEGKAIAKHGLALVMEAVEKMNMCGMAEWYATSNDPFGELLQDYIEWKKRLGKEWT
jgi:hypothetical protein